MLHEYRDIISKIKVSDARFAKIFEKHNMLNDKIVNFDSGREYASDAEIEVLKKEKLRLKDEAYTMILKYKRENDL